MNKINFKNKKEKIKENIEIKKANKLLYEERKKHYKVVLEEENKRRESEKVEAPNDAFISLKHINKIYDNYVQAVFDFNLDIKEKEFIVLVGPSGCGKSTTLRMISGLEEITSGDLFINGELANDLTPKERNIAMVFQSYALYPHMTVYENMAFGLMINKYPKDEIDKRVKHAAKVLQLEDYLNRKPDALSGGQCQRVALGRAIVRNSKIFLLDEPLSNLDAKLRVAMRSEIVKLHNNLGATSVYVTHDQTEAMTMATRIVVMNKGYVQQIGTPSEIYDHPNNIFVATFIGSPAMNIIDGVVKDKRIVLSNGYEIKCENNWPNLIKEFYKKEIEIIDEKITSLKCDYIKRNKDIFEEYNEILHKKPANLMFFKLLHNLKGKTSFEVAREYAFKTLHELDASYDGTILKETSEEKFIEQFKEEYKNAYFLMQLKIDENVKSLIKAKKEINNLLKENEIHVKVGVRPENVSCTLTNGENSYLVSVSELLGSEYFVHFDFDEGLDLIAKVTSTEKIVAGAKMNIAISENTLHLFDPITNKAIN